MFSGIGGFELGIKQAYGNMVNRYKEREEAEVLQGDCSDPSSDELQGTPTCVGYSEIDKYAIQIYSHHFPTHVNYGDAKVQVPRERRNRKCDRSNCFKILNFPQYTLSENFYLLSPTS